MKIRLLSVFSLILTAIISYAQPKKDILLDNGNVIRVTCLSDNIFRLQVSVDGQFAISPMEKYGIVRHSWQGSDVLKTERKKGKLYFSTPKMRLVINTNNGIFELYKPNGDVVLQSGHPMLLTYNGDFGIWFDIQDNELFYGLGDIDREHLQHRGHLMRSWVSYGQAYAPAPFLMSSTGWALFMNTTFKHYYDIGKRDPDKIKIWGEKGTLDIYLIVGDDYQDLMIQYTEITGKPRLLPQKAYGLIFVENREVNQFELLEHALKFREQGIPCDYLGLEPGWMESFRDPTVNINWDFKKFLTPSLWGDRFRNEESAKRTFIGGLDRLGYKLSLWTLCEYDLSYEAERQAQKDFPELYSPKKEQPFLPVNESTFDIRAHKERYFNQNTVISEPWFEHFKKFLTEGVRAIKQDPAYIINEHPDWHYGNGMNDDEMHNLYQPIYQRQMYEGWKNFLNERPMFYFCTGYAGLQHWAPTWAGDEGGRERALVSMLNHSMTAHSNVICDMDIFTKEGIHFGFFQGWSQINSWWNAQYPWLLGDLEETFKYYSRLRYRLMPYIYSYAQLSHQTAMPIMRAMPLIYPDDPNCEDLTTQYMFGDYLLVGAFSDSIYLPVGKWIDYWTKQEYEGNQQIDLQLPTDKGGGLFLKAGAIIPEWPYVDYVRQKEIDTMNIQIYPYRKSSFSLIEDEGEGFGYEKDETATVKMDCSVTATETVFLLHKTEGKFPGMLEDRFFSFAFHIRTKPSSVSVNNEKYKKWDYDTKNKVLSIPALPYNVKEKLIIKIQ